LGLEILFWSFFKKIKTRLNAFFISNKTLKTEKIVKFFNVINNFFINAKLGILPDDKNALKPVLNAVFGDHIKIALKKLQKCSNDPP
jgi:hypothetical protein